MDNSMIIALIKNKIIIKYKVTNLKKLKIIKINLVIKMKILMKEQNMIVMEIK